MLIVLFLISISEVVLAIEEPSYTVESKTEVYEIRKYASILVAETKIDANFEDAGNKAFRILADFIFGNNRARTKIDMTAPVSQSGATSGDSASEKIAMTAPVSQVANDNGFWVQFTMPGQYSKDTLPLPNDPRIAIREIPERRMAVLTYSGSWSEENYKEKLNKLRDALTKASIKTVGEPVFARYNSPIQLWFLRRNEIWLQLAP